MRCTYKNIDCPHVDTAGMSKLKECEDCEVFYYANQIYQGRLLRTIT